MLWACDYHVPPREFPSETGVKMDSLLCECLQSIPLKLLSNMDLRSFRPGSVGLGCSLWDWAGGADSR